MTDQQIKQLQADRLHEHVKKILGIDLVELEDIVLYVSNVSSILGKGHWSETANLKVFVWSYQGQSSVQLYIKEKELILFQKPKIAPTKFKQLEMFMASINYKITRYW
jgi:NACalpha-BTF3-like transcription factor